MNHVFTAREFTMQNKTAKNNNKCFSTALILSITSLLSACMEDFSFHPNDVAIESPQLNDFFLVDDLAPGATQVLLSYSSELDDPLIYLNGQKVEQCFNFEATQASADLSCMSDFIRQGDNTLTVDPMKMGPARRFTVDSKGPQIVVYDVAVNDGNVTVSGKMRDASRVNQLTLNGNSASINGDTFFVTSAEQAVNGLYTFSATDEHGQQTIQQFLTPGSEISPILDVRVDERFLGAVLPVLEDAVSGLEAPEGTEFLENLEGLTVPNVVLGIPGEVTVKSLFLQNMRFDDVSIDNNANFVLDMFAYPSDADEDVDTTPGSIHNDGSVDTSQLGVKVGVIMTVLGFAVDMELMIETMDIEAIVDFQMVNGELTVVLDKSNTALTMHDIRVPSATVDLGWLGKPDLSGIIEPLLASGGMDDLIVNIIQGTIDENMKTLEFPFQFYKQFNENAAADFGFVLNPLEASTNAGVADNIGNMMMNYRGVFESYQPMADVKPALGSLYIDNASLPPVDDEGDDTALAVSVSSNMVNQLMLALYQSGLMHFTIYGGESDEIHLELDDGSAAPIYFGPGATDGWGDNDDLRVVLSPRTPPQFKMKGEQTEQATLSYYGAAMSVDKKTCSNGVCTWDPQFSLDLDVEAGVLMRVSENNTFEMTVDGIPQYEVNDLQSNLPPPFDFLINDTLVSFALDQVLRIAIPQIAETALELNTADLCKLTVADYQEGDFCWSEGLTTEKVSSEKGHLNFKMGVQ